MWGFTNKNKARGSYVVDGLDNLLIGDSALYNHLNDLEKQDVIDFVDILLYRIYSSCINGLNIGSDNRTTEALADKNVFGVFKKLLLTGEYEGPTLTLYQGVFLNKQKVKINNDDLSFGGRFQSAINDYLVHQLTIRNRISISGTVVRGIYKLREITETIGQSRVDRDRVDEATNQILSKLLSTGSSIIRQDAQDTLTMIDAHNNIEAIQTQSYKGLVACTGLPLTYFEGLEKGGSTSGISLIQQEAEIKRALRDLYTPHFRPILRNMDLAMGWGLGSKLNYEQNLIDNIQENIATLEFLNQDLIIPEHIKQLIIEKILGEEIITEANKKKLATEPKLEDDTEETEKNEQQF